MKSLFAVACVLTLIVGTADAQRQCNGTSCGTNQCGMLNQRAPATDPVPVPEITPTSVEKIRIEDDKITGYNAGPKVTFASTRVTDPGVVKQTGGNFALFGANINRNVPANNQNVELMLENLERRVADIQSQVVDERVQGNQVDAQKIKAEILAELMSPDEVYEVMSASPRFQGLVNKIMESKESKRDIVWTIEPVTD